MEPGTEEEQRKQAYWDQLYPCGRVFRYMGLGLLNLVGDCVTRSIATSRTWTPHAAPGERRAAMEGARPGGVRLTAITQTRIIVIA